MIEADMSVGVASEASGFLRQAVHTDRIRSRADLLSALSCVGAVEAKPCRFARLARDVGGARRVHRVQAHQREIGRRGLEGNHVGSAPAHAPDFAERFIKTAVDHYKGIDIIVNNAG